MSQPRILVAGIGNIFLGDDAFGIRVVERLVRRNPPQEVHVVDFGIRGLDLVYSLLDGYESVILIDAMPRGGAPGTLYLMEPTLATPTVDAGAMEMVEAHSLDPVKVLRLASTLGSRIEQLFVVGCEPEPADDPEEMQMEMSAAVLAAVDDAVPLVESLIDRLLRGQCVEAK